MKHLYGLFFLLVYNLNVLGYHTYVVGTNHFIVHNNCDKPKNPKRVGKDQMKKGDAHKFKTDVLKDSSLGNIDKKMAHYDIYQDVANDGRLWLKNKTDKSIWIDTYEYFKRHFWRKIRYGI